MPRRPSPVPDSLIRVAARQSGLVSVRQCAGHGVTRQEVAGLVRRTAWVQVARGVYDTRCPAPAGVHELDRLRRRAAVLGLLTHPGSVATGVCALVLQGVRGAPTRVVAEVTYPDGSARRPHPPARLHRIPLSSWDDVDGFPCATVQDALAQAVPTLPRFEAVALMDSALYQRKLTRSQLDRTHDAARHHRDVARTHAWWDEVDGRSESPAESWARLSCTDVGFRPDAVQLDVSAGGRVFARVDLAWRLPDGGALLVEIDGHDEHSTPRALFGDRTRQNRLDTRRTLVRRFTGVEARNGRVAADVARLLTDVGWRPQPLPGDAVLRID